MAEQTLNIAITTTANTTGATQATAAVRAATAATNPWVTASRNATQAQTQQAQATQQVAAATTQAANAMQNAQPHVQASGMAMNTAARSGANFGQAMLQGSRGVQDFAAAGIPGMVNNVESLATALGLGASAAGGLTLAFVGLELLMRNWDTWFGENKAEQAKAFWSAMTPDEAQMTRLREADQLLANQAANLERLAEIKKANIQADREAEQMLKKQADVWKGIVPTPEERGDLPPLPGTEPETPAMREARRKVEETKADTQAKVGTFQGLDAATEAQRKRVADIARIASQDARRNAANAADRAEIDRLAAFENDGGPVPADVAAQLGRLRQRVQDRDAQMRSDINAVPGLTDGLTGDPEKDREQLQARAAQERERLAQLEAQRLQAARDAETAARAQAQAEQGLTGQAGLENQQRAANAERVLADNDPQMMLAPAPGQFAGADERGGLTEALERLRAGQSQNTAAAQQVAQAADNVVSQSTQLQQRLSGALSTIAESFAAISSKAQSVAAEFEAYRDAKR